ncbi:MAG: hypothetical protein AMXMBFR84_47850 [Candidatus Hydrogenedentota bacterium]
MRARILLAMGLVFFCFVSNAQVVEDTKRAVEDAAITARIETTFLLNKYLNPLNINTTTQSGVVTLTGSVADEVQHRLAEDIAKSVEGVTEVKNNLTVVPTVVSDRPKRSWRERVDDMSLAAAIRSRLLYHREFKGLRIGVDVAGGEVTLYGVVNTNFQKDNIGLVASETRGVETVINNLTVQEREPLAPVSGVVREVSDEYLEKRIETAILLNRRVSIRNLSVDVVDATCILTGTVDADEQKQVAEDIALSIAGVEKVDNKITIFEPSAPTAPQQAPEALEPTAQ